MAKNIVFFSDGTGNDDALDGDNTNVVMLCRRALHDEGSQVKEYDAGVGTGEEGLISDATGRGISANILDGYRFIARHYVPGDYIFLFGFSRGAYTVRSLASFIELCGVVERKGPAGTDVSEDTIEDAYSVYQIEDKAKQKKKAAEFRERHVYAEHRDEDDREKRAVHFIGVWDTVRALGVTVRGRNFEVPHFEHRFHNHDLSPYVRYAYHALAIHDRRRTHHPTIWNEPTKAQEIGRTQGFEQVWFPGMHRDVGGGYKERGLANITLRWMMKRALAANPPLRLSKDFAADPYKDLTIDVHDVPHDSRGSLWRKFLYPDEPRTVCKGTQQAGSTEIKKTGEGDVSAYWLDHFEKGFPDPDYDPESMHGHPDYKRALEQLKAGKKSLEGPWQHIVPKDKD